MGHIILLGDSIFDNARYVPGGPSVIEHLRKGLPSGWRATLLAIDGSVAAGIPLQLRRLPSDATHLVVSVGGNNALDYSSLVLHEPARSFAEVLFRLAEIRAEFQKEYRSMLHDVRERGLPVVVCTIYDAIPGLEPPERTGSSSDQHRFGPLVNPSTSDSSRWMLVVWRHPASGPGGVTCVSV